MNFSQENPVTPTLHILDILDEIMSHLYPENGYRLRSVNKFFYNQPKLDYYGISKMEQSYPQLWQNIHHRLSYVRFQAIILYACYSNNNQLLHKLLSSKFCCFSKECMSILAKNNNVEIIDNIFSRNMMSTGIFKDPLLSKDNYILSAVQGDSLDALKIALRHCQIIKEDYMLLLKELLYKKSVRCFEYLIGDHIKISDCVLSDIVSKFDIQFIDILLQKGIYGPAIAQRLLLEKRDDYMELYPKLKCYSIDIEQFSFEVPEFSTYIPEIFDIRTYLNY